MCVANCAHDIFQWTFQWCRWSRFQLNFFFCFNWKCLMLHSNETKKKKKKQKKSEWKQSQKTPFVQMNWKRLFSALKTSQFRQKAKKIMCTSENESENEKITSSGKVNSKHAKKVANRNVEFPLHHCHHQKPKIAMQIFKTHLNLSAYALFSFGDFFFFLKQKINNIWRISSPTNTHTHAHKYICIYTEQEATH